MEVEEETTSNHLEEPVTVENTTVINETLIVNTTSTDKESDLEMKELISESNTREEGNSFVSVPKSEDTDVSVMVEEVVHCRENLVVIESLNVVEDANDGAKKEIDAIGVDVAAMGCDGSEVPCTVNVVGEISVIQKDENEGDEEETVKEEEGDTNIQLEDDEVTVNLKSDGGGDVQLEDVEAVQELVGSDVRKDDSVQQVEAITEEQVVEEAVKEEEMVADKEEAVGVKQDVKNEYEETADGNLEDEEKVQEAEIETDSSTKGGGGKRKRGGKISKATPKSSAKPRKTTEEDVCFICFDGGDLVLCDRRNCPKAYHPSCVNRDEAFFHSKGSWSCGWHLCSYCEKKADYMCYTCTFSLCKACTKTSVFLCVREKEKKGFCEACIEPVMLIEKEENQGNLNFDDKNNWEHLFKDYWTETKAKHNLSLAELEQAKSCWKGSGKQESVIVQPDINDDNGSGSDNPPENLKTRKSKRNTKKQKSNKENDSSTGAAAGSAGLGPENAEWVSKDLLEFVTHMRNGDSSVISQFEVQDLLLEYIKRNKLRDPNHKSQIICDARLENLFGKPRVAHIEMLKLLESHFLVKEDTPTDDLQGTVVDTEISPVDDKDKKRKGRKKSDKRGPQSNREDYAAIDTHNITLIYLRRKLVEDLLDDMVRFHEIIVGTFVRIRISGAHQKQDIYRLVQVTGTSEAAWYTLSKRTTCTMLEILNLDKTETISIDSISNQDFMEDECKRLRQSIKCGLISRLTVGDVLDKAMELQAVRVNDWFETEIVRLNHLRDRAKCVEKLNVLKTPEERARRLEEFPVIHNDPTMDPEHESEDDTDPDDKKQESWGGTPQSKNYEFTKNSSNRNFSIKTEDATISGLKTRMENSQDPFVQQPIILEKPSVASSLIAAESAPKINETEKILTHEHTTHGAQNSSINPAPDTRHEPANFPSPTPNKGMIGWTAGQTVPLTGPSSPSASNSHLIACGNKDSNLAGSIGFSTLQPHDSSINTVSVVPQVVDQMVQNPVQSSQLGQPVALADNNIQPQMVQSVSGQNPQGWPQNVQLNPSMNMAGLQPLAYNQWTGVPNMVQNPVGNFMTAPQEPWTQQFPFPVNQPNMQQPPQPLQPNINWGTMTATPNMGWVGPNAGNLMNWAPMVQGPQGAGTIDPTWMMQAGNLQAGWIPQPTVQGVMPNQSWVATPQGPVVAGNGNPGWVGPVPPGSNQVAPGAGWVAPNVNQVPTNMNTGWVSGPGNQGASVPNQGWVPPSGNQGATPPGNTNQNRGPRNRGGNWGGNDYRGNFSGHRKNRGYGFGGNRSFSNKQDSFRRDDGSNDKDDGSTHKDSGLFHGDSGRSSDQ
ncbi:hypothetical protein E3N88_18592 [Mikania micrantha]|uniref:PHD-type domain-containing protein n=1 Tax=Mikania micrantha TaxID=192012 RepID=A0A5N6NKV5_9ASTR|nr:hypothetical protein E3N88_18592 [Mikania micrantha]